MKSSDRLRERKDEIAKISPVLFQVGSKLSKLLLANSSTEFDRIKTNIVTALKELADILDGV